MTEPLPNITDAVRDRLAAARAGITTTSVVADDVLASIRAGHVGQVTIFCDSCLVEEKGDYIGETRDDRFGRARAYLTVEKGWKISHGQDLCPECGAG